ncbi:hypothetical protein B0T18DRAFT_66250 [Schizothecium vesticola]|uniref:Uncharacterized protein n=1 Tax=Schizothecium vesticola TaxID=314040 RepID=A0AA40KA28_9PEZI|nr:hypothetical protein B0T18DRAFT_66250 [Schizothecium vesticola]
MPGKNSRRQDPNARINRWDDGYEYIQGQTPSPSTSRNPGPYFSPPVMSGGRQPSPSRRRRDADDYRPRRRDPSPLSDHDTPRRRRHRTDSPPSYRSVESQSPPPRRSRHHDDEPLSRRRSARDAPQSRGYTARSPSPPPRRNDREDRHRHHQEQRYRSPSPADRRRRRSADRYHDRPSSPPRNRGPPQAEKPGLNRSKTTTGIGLSPRWQQAAAAALQAGGIAAMTMRSEPGPWAGPKGMKVMTAALGAGAMKAKDKGGDDGDRKRSSGGGGASRGSGGGGGAKGGMKSKGVEMLGTALSGFMASQMAKKARY